MSGGASDPPCLSARPEKSCPAHGGTSPPGAPPGPSSAPSDGWPEALSNPPMPAARKGDVSLWQYLRLFRQDILSAQPARLYRARMARFETPFFRSFLLNEPALAHAVLGASVHEFPKSGRIREGLAPLLGNSVFISNGETWERQRRIIDPAFEGGRLRTSFPAMRDAVAAARERLARQAESGRPLEAEAFCSRLAADVIFRSLFSMPIEERIADEVFEAFRSYQEAAPIVNLGALVALPRFLPRLRARRSLRAARRIRALIGRMVRIRARQISEGTAPDDLATRIMRTPDPLTGRLFDAPEMIDQVAIFFLAGHETSAAALGWALYLLALSQPWQSCLAEEAAQVFPHGPARAEFAHIRRLKIARAVFREALRLYPPVPMLVRENRRPAVFRGKPAPPGSQIVISPWHLHRHERLWRAPHAFDPARWLREGEQGGEGSQGGRASDPAAPQPCPREAFIPFSAGPRVCPGAGFAMSEGTLALALLLRDLRVSPAQGHEAPVPRAHLTVRSANGIWLDIAPREAR